MYFQKSKALLRLAGALADMGFYFTAMHTGGFVLTENIIHYLIYPN